eukprot:7590501-Lingulodinium_polyedra.AAC.1
MSDVAELARAGLVEFGDALRRARLRYLPRLAAKGPRHLHALLDADGGWLAALAEDCCWLRAAGAAPSGLEPPCTAAGGGLELLR